MDGEIQVAESTAENTAENIQAVAETAQPVHEKTGAANGAKPEGYDIVDLPEPVQKRFNKVYGQMKYQERALRDNEAIVKAQADRIEDLMKGQTQIVGFLHEKDYQDAEQRLRAQKKEARDAGNWDAVDAIDSEILDIKAKKISLQNQPKVQAPQTTRQPQSEGLDIQQAVQRGAITHDDGQAYTAWTNETDEYGELKRPWTSPNDPRYRAALIEGQAVFRNPNYQNKSFQDKLAEIDRRLNVENRGPTQQVMGSNLTGGSRNGKMTTKLSALQEKIAIGTRMAGPGKSNDEHIAAYRKKVDSSKGARR